VHQVIPVFAYLGNDLPDALTVSVHSQFVEQVPEDVFVIAELESVDSFVWLFGIGP
jgi:hypothetical protein